MSLMKNKPKQNKSFSVDGDAYSWLVERLKETEEKEFNVSTLVNKHLNGLYTSLNRILEYFDKHGLSVDRAWVINKFFRTWSEMLIEEYHEVHVKHEAIDLFLEYHKEKLERMGKRGIDPIVGYCFQCKNENLQKVDERHGGREYSFCDFLDVEVNRENGCDHFELDERHRLIRGTCHQCKYWQMDGWCSIKKTTTFYQDNCGRFRAKDGMKEDDLETTVEYNSTVGKQIKGK